MGQKRRGKSAGRGSHGHAHAQTTKKKSGGLLIGMRGGIKKAAGVGRARSAGPGAGGAGALGKLWTGVTIALLVLALVLFARRFAGH